MASITRTKSETVASVFASHRKIRVSVEKELTIEESRELRSLLKAEERKAKGQDANSIFTRNFTGATLRDYYYGGSIV